MNTLPTARKWLEKLPGVVLGNVKTRRWDEREQDRPMDERISQPQPVEITPQLAASLQEKPMDDGRWTIRPSSLVCRLSSLVPHRTIEDAGWQQVTMLIRTMPDPIGQASVRVPRQAMLRELDLLIVLCSLFIDQTVRS